MPSPHSPCARPTAWSPLLGSGFSPASHPRIGLLTLAILVALCGGAAMAEQPVYRPRDPQQLFAAPPRVQLPLLTIPGPQATANRSPSAGSPTTSAHTSTGTTATERGVAAVPPAAAENSSTPFLDLSQPQTLSGGSGDTGIDRDMLVNFVVWMIVILCLCGLTVLGIRMLQRRGIIKAGTAGPSSGQARVIDSLSLGRNQFVQLLEIGGRQVLVASDTSGIREMVPLSSEFDASLLDASLLDASSELEDAA